MSKFRSIPIDKIIVNRAERQRRDLGDLSELKESLKRRGLLNPIIVHEDTLELVAGERRLTAASELGWSHIMTQSFEGLNDIELEQVELDENIHRLELPWKDRVAAVLRYHRLTQQVEGESWSTVQTADQLGLDRSTVSKWIRVAEEIDSGNERVAQAPKYSVALGLVERAEARQKDLEKSRVEDSIGRLSIPGISPEPKSSEETQTPSAMPEEGAPPILLESFKEWAPYYPGPRFNLLHCDFPYGIDAGDHDQGAGASFGTYDDGEEVYWDLLDTLEGAMENVVAPAAHMIFWFSMKFYEATVVRLSEMGWTVNPYPLMWHRSDNSGILPDPKRGPRQVYETALLCTRGDRFIVRAKSNLFAHPNTKEFHMSEKPKPVLTHFLEMLVDETTTFLDPTCGSGNACIVAGSLGASDILGLEIDPEFHANALINWRKSHEKSAQTSLQI